ncbi:MAG: AMP-binding protein [Prevotellaceae bacterium]|jgi:long-chain acyl-CoA synthetase|nr:AMP-binding protein [Prevotellaceae bacterium]
MQYNPQTLQQMLQQSVKKYGDRRCFSFVDGQPITYAELGEKVGEIQRQLSSFSIKPGDKVAILGHNMPNWGAAYMAITAMGAVVVPLLPDFSKVEIENVLNHSDSKAIFASKRLCSKLDEINIPSVATHILLDTLTVYRSSAAPCTATPEPHTVKPGDLAAIIYTSGTTGKNKGVMLTHRNLISQLEMVHNLQPVNEEDVFLSLLPLPHTYENSLGLLTPLLCGASVYYLDKAPTPSVLLPAVEKIRPTYMLTVPMIIEKIFRGKILPQLKANKVMRILYSIPPLRKLMHRKAARTLYQTFGGRLKFFGIGGAKLDPIVEKFLIEGKVFPYAIGYGLTETAPLIAGATPDRVRHQSTGPVLNGVTMKLHKLSSKAKEGEIWVKGPNVMAGYYKDQTLTSEVFSSDGWFKTGDLGAFDSEGNLYIKGRLKNMILGASGENIYPEEIESVINNFRYVRDSLVVEQKGRLIAMVRFNPEELEQKLRELCTEAEYYVEQLKAELKAYVNSQVNRFSQISVVVALPSDFEKTSTLKIKRYLYMTQK